MNALMFLVPAVIAEQAVCGQTDPELFFPRPGGSDAEAKEVCWSCPVRRRCLTWALDNDIQHGVWGGASEKDRRRILRDGAVLAG